MKLVFPVVLSSLFLFSSCEDSLSSVDEKTQNFESKISGPWVPPADLVKKSLAYNIDYVGAGPWKGKSGCGGSFSEGAKFLSTWVKDAFPQVSNVGGYNCRKIRGGTGMSVHATGRAIDIHFPLDGDQADNGLGDPVANYLLDHAQEMGVQLIIWDKWIWSSGRKGAERSKKYGGVHPHHDHIHMELTPDGAKKMTEWFSNPAPVTKFECPDKIDVQGGIVDNASSCFQLFGKAKYWREEKGGYSGSLRWTNAFKTETASNWARWMLNLDEAGKYEVFYYSVPEFAKFDSTRYAIFHNGKKEEIFIDQSAAKEEGWQKLGTYEFAAGAEQWVAVHDNSPIDVPEDQHVIADAIRLLPVDVNPNPNNEINNQNNNPKTNMGTTQEKSKQPQDVDVDDGCSTTNSGSSFLVILIGLFIAFRRKS